MRRMLFLLLSASALILLAGVGYFGLLQWTGNFHEVVPGEVYRAAQPTKEEIITYARRNGIRSILNLRGPNPGVEWYDAEIRQARASGIQMIDIPLFSRKRMTQAQEAELIQAMRAAPKPMLIHCAAGANRTGMASALYLAIVKGEDPAVARLQLSPIYGHLPFHFLRSYPMRESMEAALSR